MEKLTTGKDGKTNFFLSGLIPVAGQTLDYAMPWHDSLMPVGIDYTAVEKSVFECASAGCDTIWIICPPDMSPLIRHRIGEWTHDLDKLKRSGRKNHPKLHRKRIPIYYVPIHPKDQDKRDSLSWSILYGTYMSYYICKKISKWTVPNMYFVSFPYGLYDLDLIYKNRSKIRSNVRFSTNYNGKNVRDGLYTSFTYSGEDFVELRRNFRKEATSMFFKGTTDRIPIGERYSGRFFTLDKVFGMLKLGSQHNFVELPNYQQMDSWESYCDFMKSGMVFERPVHLISRKLNPIGVEYEKD